jgi:hypothetical protein
MALFLAPRICGEKLLCRDETGFRCLKKRSRIVSQGTKSRGIQRVLDNRVGLGLNLTGEPNCRPPGEIRGDLVPCSRSDPFSELSVASNSIIDLRYFLAQTLVNGIRTEDFEAYPARFESADTESTEGLCPKDKLEQGDYIASGLSEANRNCSMCSGTPVGNFSRFDREARTPNPRTSFSASGIALAGLRLAHRRKSN